MNLAKISISRPTFITCVVLLMLAVGLISRSRLGVDLFPDVTFPVVSVNTTYAGAGPEEIETLVSKPIEDEVSTISGLKRLTSTNQEGLSVIVAEFTMETDVKYAEQQIRDRIGAAKRNLPLAIDEPIVRRIDPSDQPVVTLSLNADLPPGKLYDLANEVLKPKLEQVAQVGLVEILGGRKREIHIKLDREKLRAREVSASQVAARLGSAGENIPAGKKDMAGLEKVFRTVGQFKSLNDIGSTIVNFFGNDVPVTVNDVGTVEDTLVDEASRTFVNGKKSLFINVYRQSGSNTVAVVDALLKRVDVVNHQLAEAEGKPSLGIVRDSSKWIRANVDDVYESIFLGTLFAVIVVFFFLGSARSTIITGLALPNSLIGAFILMAIAGYTINVMSLLALSLSVGLLVDDAIVVRENIYRHIEMGKSPKRASIEGTNEVRLAVIATTLAVIAVFGPVGFLSGVVGQFFKQFGLTVCFAMAISLFDALTIAPMMSAYFAGTIGHAASNLKKGPIDRALGAFDRFQTMLEEKYVKVVSFSIKNPGKVLGVSFLIFLGSCASTKYVPKTFLPDQEQGEFSVSLDMVPGTSLDHMTEVAMKVDEVIRKNKEVLVTGMTVGGKNGESNVTDFYVALTPLKDRSITTVNFKKMLREQLKGFTEANPVVKDYDAVGGGQRPFLLNITGTDTALLESFTMKVFKYLKGTGKLTDPDTNFRGGKPEFQIVPNRRRMEQLGISSIGLGNELRAQVEGVKAAKFREKGLEYDIRVRLEEDQRNLQDNYKNTYVPNINNKLIRLSDVTTPNDTSGPTKIYRQDRARYVQIAADIAPGAGMGDIIGDLDQKFKNDPDLKLPEGVGHVYIGQAENFKELADSMVLAMGLGILFIFLVLASLYESFVTPLTIMLALPLAFCGAFVALAITHQSLNIFSIIGLVMLLGVAAKNSILLVDFSNQQVQAGKTREEAMMMAGKTRLRPILMTTMALIAGTIPIAVGLNEASKQRTSMGIAIIGGLISSTLLTLIVVPAAYSFIDRFRVWANRFGKRLFGVPEHEEETDPSPTAPLKNGHAEGAPATL
jgi:HAE1 family hydrophobic/amphiphilic exporter-1